MSERDIIERQEAHISDLRFAVLVACAMLALMGLALGQFVYLYHSSDGTTCPCFERKDNHENDE